MQKQPNLLWFTALFVGWFFDFLFYQHTPGISFAIYALITTMAGFILLRMYDVRPSRGVLLLAPLILYFAIMSFVRMEPLSMILAHGFTLLLMAVAAVTYRGGQWLRYSLADYFSRALDLMGSLSFRPLAFNFESQRLNREPGKVQKSTSPLLPVLRGLLIAIPVLAFFTALLSSADLIFAQSVNSLLALLRLENLTTYILRILLVLVAAYALAGVYLHAANRSVDEKLLGLEKPLVPPFLGFTEASVVLGSVVLLFAVFVVIQFQYFFGGQANIHMGGFTYAEYARKGFGELVTVVFFALLLFLGLSSFVKRETSHEKKAFSYLGVALLALVAVMLVSSYRRLVLYETAYGFTSLRTYTHVFIVWLAVYLATVVLLDLLQRQRAFALAALLASLGFAISLTLLNVDAFITRSNIARFEQGQPLDVGYLASLTSDAVPEMVSLYQSPVLADAARDRIGAALACLQYKAKVRSVDPSWQSFHLSRTRAEQALQSVASTLKHYRLNDSSWPVTVTTPLNEKFECSSMVDD